MWVVFPLFSLASCQPDTESLSKPQEQFHAFGITSMDEAQQALGDYADVFAFSDGNLLFRGTTYSNGIQQLSRINEFSVTHVSPFTQLRANNGLYYLGDYCLIFASEEGSGSYMRLSAPADDNKNLDMNHLFGKNVTFRRGNDKQNWDFQVDVQAPAMLNAELTSITLNDAGLARVSPNVSSIHWASDTSNLNGVVLYLHWAGDMAEDNPFPAEATDVHRVLRADDTGSHVVDANLLEGIPSGAIVFLYIIRGDVVFAKDVTGEHKCAALEQTQFVIVVDR